MFGHYPYIQPQHFVALESAVRNHGVTASVTSQLLARMYKIVLEGLNQPVQETGFHTSSLRAGNITLSSATDAKTGVWIQLALVEGQKNPFITVGQKWAMEQQVPAHGNVSTIFW